MVEKKIAPIIVTANSLNNFAVSPSRKTIGKNILIKTNDVETTAKNTSLEPWIAASILDEPSSNLDMKSTKTIEKYLVKEKRNKKIIMVTHDLFQAKRLADEIIFINEGKIIEISPKKKFLNSPNKIVQKFLDGGLF